MKVNSAFLLQIFIIISFTLMLHSCKPHGPNPSDITGKFILTFSLKEGTGNKEKINHRINEAMEEVSDQFTRTKNDLDREFDVSQIDTSTVEGKIEYSAKMFGKSMSQWGQRMGELGKNMGGIFGHIAEAGINLSADIINKIEVNVELQEDGDIIAEDSAINIGTSNASWDVKGDEFFIRNRNKESAEIFKITDRNSKGFTLEKDNLVLHFSKIDQ